MSRATARRAAARLAAGQTHAGNKLANIALSRAAEDFYGAIRVAHIHLTRLGVNGDETGRVTFHSVVGPYGFRSQIWGRRTRLLMWGTQSERRALVHAVKRFPREAAHSADVRGVREAFRLALKLARMTDQMAAQRFNWGDQLTIVREWRL